MKATLLRTDGGSPSPDALTRFFSHCGFCVETARSRREWLAKVQSLEPEVALVDLDVPWGCHDAAAALSPAVRRGFALPAVFVVGTAPAETLSRLTGVPLDACFQKPLQTENLLDRVGLAVALIDLLRRQGGLPARRPPIARPAERPQRRVAHRASRIVWRCETP